MGDPGAAHWEVRDLSIAAFRPGLSPPEPGASHGIILCRAGPRGTEAVLVQARYTYAFSEFVFGRYGVRDEAAVRALAERMTMEERSEAYGLNFEAMWARVRFGAPNSELYCGRRDLFAANWLGDGGERLRRLLRSVRGAGRLRWEFPKGRRVGAETDLACAMREFVEETGIPAEAFRLLPGFARRVSFQHCGRVYTTVYYLAALTGEAADPRRNLGLHNLGRTSEVSDIAWADMAAIRVLGDGGTLPGLARPAFAFFRRRGPHWGGLPALRLPAPPPAAPPPRQKTAAAPTSARCRRGGRGPQGCAPGGRP